MSPQVGFSADLETVTGRVNGRVRRLRGSRCEDGKSLTWGHGERLQGSGGEGDRVHKWGRGRRLQGNGTEFAEEGFHSGVRGTYGLVCVLRTLS